MRRMFPAAALALLVACGGKGAGATPEATFENARTAGKNKDWKSFFRCCDPRNAELIVGMMLLGAGFTAMNDKAAEAELLELQKKHGLDKKKPAGGSDPRAAAREELKDVKDLEGLFDDTMKFIDARSQGKNTADLQFADAILKDLKIDGEKAKASAVSAGGKTTSVEFVKRDGLWYLSFNP